jgi:hypothetical protein
VKLGRAAPKGDARLFAFHFGVLRSYLADKGGGGVGGSSHRVYQAHKPGVLFFFKQNNSTWGAGCLTVLSGQAHRPSVLFTDLQGHSRLCHRSFATGTVSHCWRTAIVSPIHKTGNPASPSNYRHISVTPILSRFGEKMVVGRWLRPAMPQDMLLDQYAFKPTESTTCALVHFTHHVTRKPSHSSDAC